MIPSESEHPVDHQHEGHAHGFSLPDSPPELLKKFNVTVPRQEFTAALDQHAEHYCDKVKVPGFRQGKVPPDMVKTMYKQELTDEVVQELVGRRAYEYIRAEKWRVASQPVIEKIDFPEERDLTADMAVEVVPEFVLPDLKDLKVEVPKDQLRQEAFAEAKQIDALLDANRRRLPVRDRGVQADDWVLLQVQSRVSDSKRMTPKKKQWYVASAEAEGDILGLREEILGKKSGEKMMLKNSYPADFKKKIWSGKEVEHFIEVEMIYELKRPDMNLEFIQSLGFQSEEEFKKKLRAEYEEQQKRRLNDVKIEWIFKQLTDTVTFPVPASLIRDEMTRHLSQSRQPVAFANDDERDKFLHSLRESAEKSVRMALILERIKEHSGLAVTREEVAAEIRHIAAHNNLPEAEVQRYYEEGDRREQLRDRLLDGKAIAWLKDVVRVKEV